VTLKDIAKPGPEVITIAITARRGITRSKLWGFALQNETVDRSKKAQSQRRVGRIIVMVIQNGTANAPSSDILCGMPQQG
jgi:hypothetical protein